MQTRKNLAVVEPPETKISAQLSIWFDKKYLDPPFPPKKKIKNLSFATAWALSKIFKREVCFFAEIWRLLCLKVR